MAEANADENSQSGLFGSLVIDRQGRFSHNATPDWQGCPAILKKIPRPASENRSFVL
jgi:hypothetical protein